MIPPASLPPSVAHTGPGTQRVSAWATAGRERVATWFGAPFAQPVEVRVVPDRAGFDAALTDLWGTGGTACWMVGAAGATTLVVLSPDAWATEACEHDPADEQAASDLLTHELVHAYHAQRNPTDDFEGMDELGWFVEGLATHVSGQLVHRHAGRALEALQAGAGPEHLATAWSGPYRYGVCGSLVAYIDARWGRPGILGLLEVTSQEDALALLGTDEATLLGDWAAWVKGASAPAH